MDIVISITIIVITTCALCSSLCFVKHDGTSLDRLGAPWTMDHDHGCTVRVTQKNSSPLPNPHLLRYLTMVHCATQNLIISLFDHTHLPAIFGAGSQGSGREPVCQDMSGYVGSVRSNTKTHPSPQVRRLLYLHSCLHVRGNSSYSRRRPHGWKVLLILLK